MGKPRQFQGHSRELSAFYFLVLAEFCRLGTESESACVPLPGSATEVLMVRSKRSTCSQSVKLWEVPVGRIAAIRPKPDGVTIPSYHDAGLTSWIMQRK